MKESLLVFNSRDKIRALCYASGKEHYEIPRSLHSTRDAVPQREGR
jgi:hypothetical protein